MEYTKGTKVIHKRTLANETVVGCCKMKCNGEWIDGVKFLYNDEPIEYDHVYELSETQYRN